MSRQNHHTNHDLSRRELLEQQLEQVRKEGQGESACLMSFGFNRAKVLGAAGCSVQDLDLLRQWTPDMPSPRNWSCVAETKNDASLVLCIKGGRMHRIEKMGRAYLVHWFATIIYGDWPTD